MCNQEKPRLTVRQQDILLALGRLSCTDSKTVATMLHTTQGAVTRGMNILCELGLAEKSQTANDPSYRATRKGRKLRLEIDAQRAREDIA